MQNNLKISINISKINNYHHGLSFELYDLNKIWTITCVLHVLFYLFVVLPNQLFSPSNLDVNYKWAITQLYFTLFSFFNLSKPGKSGNNV